MQNTILEMKNITKDFPGVKALDNVNFKVKEGEIHCLVGENGAGKSTLMKVLSGVHPHGTYQGEILLNGISQHYSRIDDSKKAGIAIIYQELALIPEMTVYENVFLGHEINKGIAVDWNETIKQATQMLKKVQLDANPSSKVKDLGVGQQQLVEIAKALSMDVKILLLDEPTSSLNEDDSANLLNLLRELKQQGVTCVLISHKLSEVLEIADTITVLRDGKTVCTIDRSSKDMNEQYLIKQMVGREIINIYPERDRKEIGETVLEVKDWSAYDPNLGRYVLKDVNFKVKKGEIVAFAGLMGSGRTELALSLFGNPLHYRITGEMKIDGKPVHFNHPEKALKDGLAYVTEDRKGNGLILIHDVKQNISLANLAHISTNGIVDKNKEIVIAQGYKESLDIKTPTIEKKVLYLSGGNQQKVSVAKWLFVNPDIMILDEPTRGIDVGAKFEIYTIMNKLVEQGMSILMLSSELLEVLGMSDRVYIVASGRIAGEMPASEATQEKIMELATN
jgi:putative multiple sugar transport system ATP-binding protein